MGGGHRPGQVSVVTVLAVDESGTVTFQLQDPSDISYFPVGGRFVSFNTPIGGDMAGEANAEPQPGS